MEKTLAAPSHVTHGTRRIPFTSLRMGLGWGFLGGLAGTLTMDLVLMAALAAFGMPALTCFSIVGNTVARFLSMPGLEDAGAVWLGVVTHYLVGPLFGAIFGVIVTQVPALRVTSVKKCLLWAILYIEILSQPLMATTPILLKMTRPETAQWYGGAFVMHLILAIILGLVVGCALKRTGVHRQAGKN